MGSIRAACEQALGLYPVFQVKTLDGPLIWSQVEAIIGQFQPNILIMVGHGSSGVANEEPTIAFVRTSDPGGVEPVPVAALAKALARAGSCSFVSLISCDLVRARGYSAATELVHCGIAEVVAMQGSIQQESARIVLDRLLAETLAGTTIPVALAAARRAAGNHPHAILPAAFRSSDWDAGMNRIGPLSELYDAALGSLRARVLVKRPMLPRQTLQTRVEAFLRGNGVVAAVEGGFGNGTSTVLQVAAAALMDGSAGRRNRPVLYLDCERKVEETPLGQWVGQELLRAFAENPVLRPANAPTRLASSSSGKDVGDWAVAAQISVVLDNVPARPSQADKKFVEELCGAFLRPGCRAALVIGGTGQLLQFADERNALRVGALSRQETDAYTAAFVADMRPQELFTLTGGTLLLLDVERRMRQPRRGMAKAAHKGGRALDRYLDRLDRWMSREAREAAARLAHFPHPIGIRIAQEFVVPDLPPTALDEVLDVGLATTFEDLGSQWVLIPGRKSDGLRRRNPGSLKRAANHMTAAFVDRYDKEAKQLVQTVASIGGAATYLRALQVLLAGQGWSDIAMELPYLAQGSKISGSDLFYLFQPAIQIAKATREADPDILIAAARAALNVGESVVATEWLALLPNNLSPIHELGKLAVRLAVLKDQAQLAALPEIEACIARATQLLQSAIPEDESELNRLRDEWAIDKLPTALFLMGDTAKVASVPLASILDEVQPSDRALALATFAEREMKESADEIDWSSVGSWVTEAALALEASGDDRTRAYCFYQQAQYLRRRPGPRPRDAWEAYEKARAAGERAGEHRRVALSLARLIALEQLYTTLRPPGAEWPTKRLVEADEVAAALDSVQYDALSMRALARLQSISAEIALDAQGQRHRLFQAAQALSVPVLRSPTDAKHFGRVCAAALELELGRRGRFLLAQRFLYSFRADIKRRFGITVDVDQPDAVLAEIVRWLAAHT